VSWTIARKETRVEPTGMGKISLGHISLNVISLGYVSMEIVSLGSISLEIVFLEKRLSLRHIHENVIT